MRLAASRHPAIGLVRRRWSAGRTHRAARGAGARLPSIDRRIASTSLVGGLPGCTLVTRHRQAACRRTPLPRSPRSCRRRSGGRGRDPGSDRAHAPWRRIRRTWLAPRACHAAAAEGKGETDGSWLNWCCWMSAYPFIACSGARRYIRTVRPHRRRNTTVSPLRNSPLRIRSISPAIALPE